MLRAISRLMHRSKATSLNHGRQAGRCSSHSDCTHSRRFAYAQCPSCNTLQRVDGVRFATGECSVAWGLAVKNAIIVVASAAVLMATPAIAADVTLPVKAPPVAPAPAVSGWTGFYLGADA